MKNLYTLLFILLPTILFAQVSTEPALVIHDQPVTIFYDATQGTSGLQGADKVYMHAGVITEASENGDDWQNIQGTWGADDGVGLMTKVEGEANLWKLEMTSPREYFGVAAEEKILQIAMVFRNADGSAEGKNDQNGNIFVDVVDGYGAVFISPNQNLLRVSAGETLQISGEATETSDFSIYRNQELIQSFTASSTFSFTETFSLSDTVVYQLSATNGTETATDEFKVVYRTPSPVASIPAGLEQGINILDETTAALVLSAPGKESVYAVGNFSNWKVLPEYLMQRDGELFWIVLENLDPNEVYKYYYLVDQAIDVADPYSELILDNGQYADAEIDETRYPNLPSFPAEAQTDRLTVFSTTEEEYQWQTTNYTRPEVTDLVIYELLVRDFDASESFQGVIDRLDYLDSLNVNAIQLMPVMEFNGNNSWGYNPTFQTALDKWYGTKNKFKELVDKAHGRGIAIILDIALNHQDSPAPFIKMWSNGPFPNANNPYFNVTARHPFNVFSDANHESELTQAWVDRVNRYWLEEYKVDGYRFDLSKGFTQVDYGEDVGAWSSYDASRVALLKRMADQIWDYDPTAYIILEHFAANNEEKELADYGMLLWGNLNHNFSEAVMGYNIGNGESAFNWLSYQARGWNDPHVVGYMESHDEERIMYRTLTNGNASGDYSTRDLDVALDRLKMANAFFLLTPGPKMIWQFGEYGYDISINEGGRLSKKPILWNYLEDTERARLFRVVSELNHLKTTYEVFETTNFSMPATTAIRTLSLDGEEMDVLVVGNFSLSPQTATIEFTHTGEWYSYFAEKSLSVSSASKAIRLEPGEFHVYLDEPIFYRGEGNPLAVEDNALSAAITLYPNPSNAETIHLRLPQELAGKALSINLINLQGQRYLLKETQPEGELQLKLQLPEISAGLYMLEISDDKSTAVKRLILQ